MKKLFLAFIFAYSSAFAGQCPELSGQYHCVLSGGQYSLLSVTQELLSGPEEEELVAYSFDYQAIPGGADVIKAGLTPQADGWGWLTKCSQNRLRSVSVDGGMLAEIYLDQERAITNTLNGKGTQRCPRKNSLPQQSP